MDKAIAAVMDRRLELAQEVLEGDDAIDQREVRVEEECLKTLALHQPVAADLRLVVALLKVDNDLERVGDLAVNIAERAAYLAVHPPLRADLDFRAMGERVRTMVRQSLDALVRRDTDLARRVWRYDEAVDAMNRRIFDVLEALMEKDPSTVRRAVHAISASRHLERMADAATNIAEDVIFMVDGEVVRHRFDSWARRTAPEGIEKHGGSGA
jgi:phosphate transport system protein